MMCWDNQLWPEGHYLLKCSSWGDEEKIGISQMTLKSLDEYAPFHHLNFGQVHTLSVKVFKKVNITVNVSLGPRISGFKMKENYYD